MNGVGSDSQPAVMVVDDNFDVLSAVAAFLQRMGYRVERHCSSEDALAALGETRCDIILSDIKMPGLTGLDLLEAARRLCPETPFLLMTGYGDLDMAILAIKRGAFDFLLKPLDFDVVAIALDKAVRVKRGMELERAYQQRLEEDVLRKTAELRAATEELTIARNAAMAASRAKSQFLANVSHELRTPMTGVVGMLELLGMSRLAPQQQEQVAIAAGAAEEMVRLIDRLISFSSLDDKAVVSRRFSLRERIGELLVAARGEAERKGIAFSWVIDRSVPDLLEGNDIAFERALEAIVENSVKFTLHGRIDLTFAHSTVREGEVELLVVVSDTGVGIPSDQLDAIFDDFTQADGSLTRRFGGLGLGLAAARRSVKHAGGDLWVESREGEGSTFYFTARFAVA
ncbi:response regulator [Geobacter sp.]|uniref:ATP-binding response regulator n=1 Tax=Geobacter sp. TaxID=46610 RepID=UPI0026051E99|nr:response regulator [Geobacter sp.]